MVGTGKGAELGVLIRSAETLERAHKIQTLVLDKTGTLTLGKPAVVNVVSHHASPDELLRLAASAEQGSEHPLGKALAYAAAAKSLPIDRAEHFQALPGFGVSAIVSGWRVLLGNNALIRRESVPLDAYESAAQTMASEGGTPVFVAIDGKPMGVIAIADALRPEAKAAVAQIKQAGIDVVMLTGDNRRTADAVARQVGIDRVVADVLPADKAAHISALQREGKVVGMVGDGINDTPSLAQADVGFAIGAGSDVALEAADITLVSSNLRAVSDAVRLSKATMRAIRQNLFWAFAYNVALIPIAAGALYPLFAGNGVPDALAPALGEHGFLNPILAAAAMAISSVTVLMNSLRLRRFK